MITGFPGESDADFAQSLEFIRAAAFSDMHIFPFSPRPGTRAAEMPGQTEKSVRRSRAQIAAGIAESMALEFKLGQVGKTAEVLFERKRGGLWVGHSENYLEVAAKKGGAKNSIRNVKITDVHNGQPQGEIIC